MIRHFRYTKAYRQGEILFFKVDGKVDYHGTPTIIPNGVIRVGEKEGNEHKVEGEGQLAMFGQEKEEGIIKVEGEATVTHPEHKDVKLPKGEYVVKTQKEATGKHRSSSVKD